MVVALSGNIAQATSPRVDAPQVVTSFSILDNVVRDLIGKNDGAMVNSIVGINQNSHTHQLRANDVQKLKHSNLIVFNGLGFESAALQRAAKNTNVTLVEAGANLHDLLHGGHEHHDDHASEHADKDHHDHDHEHKHDAHEAHNHEEDALDPHVWLDPLNMPAYTLNITQALIKQQPDLELKYALRWQFYQLKLAQLHGENVKKLAPFSLEKRKVLTSHAAFSYMGRRYQIEFFAPVSGGHEAEASAKTLVDLIKQVKQDHIQAVFVENINDERLLQQLSRETGLSVQGMLYSDALSSETPDYFSLYRHNINALVKAFAS